MIEIYKKIRRCSKVATEQVKGITTTLNLPDSADGNSSSTEDDSSSSKKVENKTKERNTRSRNTRNKRRKGPASL